MNGFARASKIQWLNKYVTDNQRVALAASALLLCLFANIVDPITTEDNKIFFSLTVELLGFFASISLITLSVNALRKTGLMQERDFPVKVFVAGLSSWILYCLVGIYSNFETSQVSIARSLEDAYIGYLSLISISLFILTSLGSRDIQKGFLVSIFCFAGLILIVSLYTSRHVLWSESMSWYGIFTRADISQGYQISRASGLARMLAVLLFFSFATLFVRFIDKQTYQFSLIDMFLASALIILTGLIILLQSRGAIIAAFFAIICFVSILIIRKYKKYKLIIAGAIFVLILIGISSADLLFVPRFGNSGFFQGWSGRGEIWRLIIVGQEGRLLGCGFQCDRLLAGQSASNGVMYAFATGGLVGLVSVLVIYLLISFLWVASAFKVTKFNIVNLFSFLAIPFLLLRTISESGFLVFGFDQIILSVASGALFSSYYLQNHRA